MPTDRSEFVANCIACVDLGDGISLGTIIARHLVGESEAKLSDATIARVNTLLRKVADEAVAAVMLHASKSDGRFDEFWAVYPRRESRGHAEKAWRVALRVADADTIIDGARRYAASRAGQDPQYTKMGSTWLNGKCWDDQPPTEQPWTERPDAQWLKEV